MYLQALGITKEEVNFPFRLKNLWQTITFAARMCKYHNISQDYLNFIILFFISIIPVIILNNVQHLDVVHLFTLIYPLFADHKTSFYHCYWTICKIRSSVSVTTSQKEHNFYYAHHTQNPSLWFELGKNNYLCFSDAH